MNSPHEFKRRSLVMGALALGGLATLPACAGRAGAGRTRLGGSGPVPMRMSVDELIDVRTCIRAFRAEGCRIEAEQVGNTLVIHNYGHGGSGWSLSWGSAEIAVGQAMSVLPKRVAVVGCGIIGLTSAIAAQRAGLSVTIYAREMFQRTRSVRANGSWTPSSRIALTEPAGPKFAERWEKMARFSWKTFNSYLGVPGRPVEFVPAYTVSHTPPLSYAERTKLDPTITDSYANTGLPQQKGEFAHYESRISDIVPGIHKFSPGENPFGTEHGSMTQRMHFNLASYGALLLSEFFEMGGKFVNRAFYSPADIAALPEDVVINCPGYAARDLWNDKSVIPVRGQTGWMVPQPNSAYGLNYRNVHLLSKADGVMIMTSSEELGDLEGVGDSMELADRDAIVEAIAKIAPLFQNMNRIGS